MLKIMRSCTQIIMLSLLSVYLPAYAGDTAQVTVTGTIVASPCKVRADSQNMQVNLGDDLQSSDLNEAGSASGWKTFTLYVENCPAGTTSVTANFSGTPDPAKPDDCYLNTGTAKNIAVELQGTGGDLLGNGTSYTQNSIDADRSTHWNLQTRAYSINGGTTPGTISAAITVNFTYS